MTQNQSKKKIPGAGRFDAINSTYKNIIYLCNGVELTGYSKGLLWSECQDKTVLLERWLIRLVKLGYLEPHRTIKMDFYYNHQMSAPELILSLNPANFSYGNNEKIVTDVRLFTFLNRLYEQIRQNNIVTKSLQHKAQLISENDLYSTAYKRFKSEKELIVFVQKMIASGENAEKVMNFYREYKDKYTFYSR